MSTAGIDQFFAQIGPYLHGASSYEQTVQALYGESAAGAAAIHAKRLAIYGRFCAQQRREALKVFENTEAAINRHTPQVAGSETAWEHWVERYFVAHPMHHFEINQNGEFLPEFLAAAVAAEPTALPPYIAELADFEWWEWLVSTAPDAEGEDGADQGPLRLSATVDLRPYSYDFLSWLDSEPEERGAAPEAESSIVVFWRDRSLRGRRGRAEPLELVIVKAILEGLTIDAELAARVGADWSSLAETLSDLHAAGIVLGDLGDLNEAGS